MFPKQQMFTACRRFHVGTCSKGFAPTEGAVSFLEGTPCPLKTNQNKSSPEKGTPNINSRYNMLHTKTEACSMVQKVEFSTEFPSELSHVRRAGSRIPDISWWKRILDLAACALTKADCPSAMFNTHFRTRHCPKKGTLCK